MSTCLALQFWWDSAMFRRCVSNISCTCWTCCRCASAECFMEHALLSHFHLQMSDLNGVISDSSRVKPGDAYLIGYDLLHVPWDVTGTFALSVSSWCFFRLHVRAGWQGEDKPQYLSIQFISLCRAPCILDTEATAEGVLQGILSPSGQERVPASTPLDLSMVRLMTLLNLHLLFRV